MKTGRRSESLAALRKQIICRACKETYKDPRILPCLHTFCAECIERLNKEVGGVEPFACPMCFERALVGIGEATQLPPDMHISSLLVLLKAHTNTLTCQECEEDGSVVTSRCTDCSSYLCDDCVQAHRRLRMTKSHTIVLLEEVKQSKKQKGEKKIKKTAEDSDKAVIKLLPRTLEYCDLHPREEQKLYCDDCSVPICRDCALSEHKEHKFDKLKGISDMHRANLAGLLQTTMQQVYSIKQGVKNVEMMDADIRKKAELLQQQVEERFDTIEATLAKRKQTLLATIDAVRDEKQDRLAAQRKKLVLAYRIITSACDFVEKIVELGGDVEVVKLEDQMEARLEELNKQQHDLIPQEDDDIEYIDNTVALCAKISEFGEVVGGRGPYAPLCTAEGHMLDGLNPGQDNSLIIKLRDRRGNLWRGEEGATAAHLIKVGLEWGGGELMEGDDDDLDDDSVDEQQKKNSADYRGYIAGKVIDNGDGTYTATISLQDAAASWLRNPPSPARSKKRERALSSSNAYERGGSSKEVKLKDNEWIDVQQRARRWFEKKSEKCVLVITVRGVPIKDSPFPVGLANRRDYTQLTKPNFVFDSSTVGDIKSPLGVAVTTQQGHIVMSSHSTHYIYVINLMGTRLNKFGGRGSGHGFFKNPHAVAIDRQGRIIIADSNNHRVQVFSSEGEFLFKIGGVSGGAIPDSTEKELGQLRNPWGVAVDLAGRIVVSESGNQRVQVFTSTGQPIHTFGSTGAGPGQFESPSGLAIDLHGRIFVADKVLHRIQAFGPDGAYLFTIGSKGPEEGHFNDPMGLAFDSQGYLFVADRNNHRVQVFDVQTRPMEATVIHTFGTWGGGPSQFNQPFGVSVDAHGNVVVSDYGNHRLSVW